MPTGTVKISSKGQITIPKQIREYLKSTTVCFTLRDGNVILQPVRDAAAVLNRYARNKKKGADFRAIREKAWKDAVHEKAGRKSS